MQSQEFANFIEKTIPLLLEPLPDKRRIRVLQEIYKQREEQSYLHILPPDLFLLLLAHIRKTRNFTETIDLQVLLARIDPAKDSRFSTFVHLPHPLKAVEPKVLVLTDDSSVQAYARGLEGVEVCTTEDLRALKKEKKKVKQWGKEHPRSLAAGEIIRQIPRLMGPTLARAGTFPYVFSSAGELDEKVTQMRRRVQWRLKKKAELHAGVGHTKLSFVEMADNIGVALQGLLEVLPEGWLNIHSIIIKTTMGTPHLFRPPATSQD